METADSIGNRRVPALSGLSPEAVAVSAIWVRFVISPEELERLIVLSARGPAPAECNLSHAFQQLGVTAQNDAELLNRVEMLNNLARYEASLMNGVTKTLTLLRALQAERAAAEAEANTIDGQPGNRSLTPLQ